MVTPNGYWVRRRDERGARFAVEPGPGGDVQAFSIHRHGHRAATGRAQNIMHEPVTWFLNPHGSAKDRELLGSSDQVPCCEPLTIMI